MFRRRATITPGERFRAVDVPTVEWQVEDVETDPIGIAHARLILVGDPLTRRTLACARLLDQRCWVKTRSPLNGSA